MLELSTNKKGVKKMVKLANEWGVRRFCCGVQMKCKTTKKQIIHKCKNCGYELKEERIK